MLNRPDREEYAPFYAPYIALAPEGSVEAHLTFQLEETIRFLSSIPESKHSHRYADDKWKLKEVLGHITDTERVMSYRLLRISRGDKSPLPGFDENIFVANSLFATQSWEDLVETYSAVRRATLTLFRGISGEMWMRSGTASEVGVSARALAYIIAGHELHHLNVIKEKYLD